MAKTLAKTALFVISVWLLKIKTNVLKWLTKWILQNHTFYNMGSHAYKRNKHFVRQERLHLVEGSLLLPTHLSQQTSNNRVSDDTVNFYDVNVV